MKTFARLLIAFVVFPINSFSQKIVIDTAELNRLSTSIDSLQEHCETIKEFIAWKRGHTGYDLNIHYVIDSTTNNLFTCGYYEQYYRGDPDSFLKKTIFYCQKGQLFLATFSTVLGSKETNENKIYLVYRDSNLLGYVSLVKNKDWDEERIKSSVKELLGGYESLLSYLRNR